VNHRDAPKLAIAGAMFSLYVIWGSTYLAIRLAIDGGFPPLYMAAIRQLAAGAILYALMRAMGAPNPTRAQWKGGLIVGALLVAGGNGGISLGERSVDSSFAAIVVASMPLWVAVMGLYFGNRPTRREVIGLCVGFAGVIVLNAGATGTLGGDPIAFAAVIASPILWAWGSVLGSRVELARGPMASATQMLCGGGVLVVLGALFGEHFTAAPSTKSILALAYLVGLGSLVAFSAYGFLLRTVRPAVATSYAYVNPIVAIVLGVAFANEAISPRAIVATALTLGGVAIVAMRGRSPVTQLASRNNRESLDHRGTD
jgi:drug/metabolite transporter (DMT)-like permease